MRADDDGLMAAAIVVSLRHLVLNAGWRSSPFDVFDVDVDFEARTATPLVGGLLRRWRETTR
ncbi:hypothetical protein [Kribbella sp. NPDC048915]|uniref:hypothetical protein n=1 Tax=Kribbella sp. NPDC048915 TaxID=3155148 RepID=UPI00340F92CA